MAVATAERWLKRDDFPKKTKRGFNSSKVKEFRIEMLNRANQQRAGATADLNTQERQLKIEILKVKLAKEKGEVILLEEYRARLMGLAMAVKRACDGFFKLWTSMGGPGQFKGLIEEFRKAVMKAIMKEVRKDGNLKGQYKKLEFDEAA